MSHVVHYGCGHNLQLLVQLLTDRPVQRLVATQCQGGWACMLRVMCLERAQVYQRRIELPVVVCQGLPGPESIAALQQFQADAG